MDKAEFRAVRERCGISQKTLATMLGKSVETIKKWEKPGYFPPSSDAADLLERTLEEHRAEVGRIVDGEDGKPRATLRFYRSQPHFEGAGGVGDYAMANARSREAAAILEEHGVTVRFAYPEDGERPDPGDLTFDLSDWDWLDRPAADRPHYLHFTVSDGSHEASIITNRSGAGKWVYTGGAYDQIVGTGQYRLPDTKEELRGELADMLRYA